jgi:group I intron endonuclease
MCENIHSTGIYQIVCRTSGKRYIGSASGKRYAFSARWSRHIKDLKLNKHHCQHLQNAWNLYGEDDFLFMIVDILPKELCIEREQMYLNTIPKNQLMNTSNTASGGNGGSNKGQKRSPEQCKMQSHRCKGIRKNPDSLINYSKAAEERWRLRLTLSKKQVQAILPDGTVKVWASAREAAKELKVSHGSISLWCKGKIPNISSHLSGWTFSNV